MNKKRLTTLMQLADGVLRPSGILKANSKIEDSYNGQTSGFSVTVAMSGLLPALVIYYQQASESRNINRKNILEAIGLMISLDHDFTEIQDIKDAESLLKAAIETRDNAKSKKLKQEVIDCAIALKQIIRTYELIKS